MSYTWIELHQVDAMSNRQYLVQPDPEEARIILNVRNLEAVYTGADGKAVLRTASGGMLYVRETYDEVMAIIGKMDLDDILFGVDPR